MRPERTWPGKLFHQPAQHQSGLHCRAEACVYLAEKGIWSKKQTIQQITGLKKNDRYKEILLPVTLLLSGIIVLFYWRCQVNKS